MDNNDFNLKENFNETYLFYERLTNFFNFMKKDKTITNETYELLIESLNNIMNQYQDLYYNIDRYYENLSKKKEEKNDL